MVPTIAGSYKNLTATGLVAGTNPVVMIGFYVNSTTAGTLVFRDGGSGGTQITGTITPAIGWHFLPVGAGKAGGLHVTVANTIDVTIVYQPTAS